MIKTIEEFKHFFHIYDFGNERAFNKECLKMMKSGELDEEVFLEYLEITQSSVAGCLGESSEE